MKREYNNHLKKTHISSSWVKGLTVRTGWSPDPWNQRNICDKNEWMNEFMSISSMTSLWRSSDKRDWSERLYMFDDGEKTEGNKEMFYKNTTYYMNNLNVQSVQKETFPSVVLTCFWLSLFFLISRFKTKHSCSQKKKKSHFNYLIYLIFFSFFLFPLKLSAFGFDMSKCMNFISFLHRLVTRAPSWCQAAGVY